MIIYHFHPIHIKRQPSKKINHRKAIFKKKATSEKKYKFIQNQTPQRRRNNYKLEEKVLLPETK